jgi:hypothetical protein
MLRDSYCEQLRVTCEIMKTPPEKCKLHASKEQEREFEPCVKDWGFEPLEELTLEKCKKYIS